MSKVRAGERRALPMPPNGDAFVHTSRAHARRRQPSAAGGGHDPLAQLVDISFSVQLPTFVVATTGPNAGGGVR
jgi:hypothetical protein